MSWYENDYHPQSYNFFKNEEKIKKDLIIHMDEDYKKGDYDYKVISNKDDENYEKTLLKLYNRVEHQMGYKITINYDNFNKKEKEWVDYLKKEEKYELEKTKEKPQLVMPVVDENIFCPHLILTLQQFLEVMAVASFNTVIFFTTKKMKKRIENDEDKEDLPIYFKKIKKDYNYNVIMKKYYDDDEDWADDIYIGVLRYTFDYSSPTRWGDGFQDYLHRKDVKEEYQNDLNNINITIETN